ncbi:hypothetical protein CO230_08990 [Chryseobacterium sp. 6424]|uniref:T9SS type B sorting domain-containing protein n=1 Tax=Chryseobacterium sp. 6424 TaxID=2039166 RepID=UPI000EFB52F1|nr:T9SS type B sorting domain-containing protein [Chryseobacterium sp. 6424]AYO58247.1 hypothetical protein CO230_08990 [Chryseobacterium sp. 6424]
MKNLYTFLIILVTGYYALHKGQVCTPFTITDSWGSEDVTVNCDYNFNSTDCISLTSNLPTLRETTSYQVESTAFTPYIPFNSGTPLNANYDDLFAQQVNIPFTFCFFGQSFNQLVIGSNGLVTFDVSQLGKISYPNIEAINPNPLLPRNSIFGVLQDLVFSNIDSSEIYYSVIQSGACRKLVINFFEGRTPGCQTRSSTQIVLTEFTNEIEIFIDRKPLPCATARFSNALLGIMNADGTLGYSPANRNTGVWEANGEGWRFSPAGNTVSPVIEWYAADNTRIGTGNSLNVCPQQSTTYTARAMYNICGSVFTLTDSINVTLASGFPVARDYTKVFCLPEGTSETVNLDDYRQFLTSQDISTLIFSYHNSLADAQNGVNALPNTITLSAEQTINVRIQNQDNPECYRVARLTFQFINQLLATDRVTVCDANNDGVENGFVLSSFTPQLLTGAVSGTVTYHLSAADAQNSRNPVTTVNLRDGMQFWLRFTTSGCAQVLGPVTVQFTPGPRINTPLTIKVRKCDINDDNAEPYNYNLNISPLVSNDPNVTIRYYLTYQEAYTGIGTELSTVREGVFAVYVRVEEPGGCFSVGEILLDVDFSEVEANAITVNRCFNGTEDVPINLDELTATMLVAPTTGITITYHRNNDDAQAGVGSISPQQVIDQNGNSVTQRYWVRFTQAQDCYTVRPITIVLTHPVAITNTFSRCDIGNDGTETFSLNAYNSPIAGAQPAAVRYFPTQQDAQNDTNPVTTLTLTGTTQLYIRVTVNGCTEVYPVTFTLSPTPVVVPEITVNRSRVCDNNNDETEGYNLRQHESEIYSGTDAVTFTYFTSYTNQTLGGQITNPTNYNASRQNIVYVRTAFTSGDCFSVSRILLNLDFIPAPVLTEATLRTCDEQFNFNETFTLTEAIEQMFDPAQNATPLNRIRVSFYNTEAQANAGVAGTEIGNTRATLQSLVTVYARFQVIDTGCYSVKPIHLRTYFPPKAISSVISGICDHNLDGQYEVNLLQYTSRMVDIPDPEQRFFFYRTLNDAQNNINVLTNPENFTTTTLPFTLFVKVENIPGCNDVSTVELRAGTPVPLLTNAPFSLETCDIGNDGTEIVDLRQFESQIFAGATFEYFQSMADIHQNINQIQDPGSFRYTAAAGNRIFVKVSYAGFCPALSMIDITLKRTPMFDLPDYYFCPYNDDSVDIQPDFTGLDIVSYEWRDPSGAVISTQNQLLNVNTTGTYSVSVVATNGCTFTERFEVRHFEVPIITQLVANGNTFTVLATGSKTILYSIDGATWQTGNVFYNLPVGQTTFYVKFSGEDCIGLPKKGVVVNIPNAFTPNEDGINDIWEVKDLDVFDGANSTVQIFDRQQVLVHQQQAPDRLTWNGRWLGRPVPTDTYWYVLKLPDGRVFYGWVFLKNRN